MNNVYGHTFQNQLFLCAFLHGKHVMPLAYERVITCRLCAFTFFPETVVSSRLSQVTPFIAIAQLNFIKESTSYIHNTVLGISNTTFT